MYDIRRKEAALGEEDSDKDLVVLLNLAENLRELIVLSLREGIELALIRDGDDGNAAAVFDTED